MVSSSDVRTKSGRRPWKAACSSPADAAVAASALVAATAATDGAATAGAAVAKEKPDAVTVASDLAQKEPRSLLTFEFDA